MHRPLIWNRCGRRQPGRPTRNFIASLLPLAFALATGFLHPARAAEDAAPASKDSPATKDAASTKDASSAKATPDASKPADSKPADNIEEKWGIKVSSVFLSAGGNMVDFRYRVLDPVKAATLTKAENKPQLLNQGNGSKLIVPSGPKTGPMRQTVKQPVAGKIYFIMFANTRHQVKSGDKVTITVGDFKAENLTVE